MRLLRSKAQNLQRILGLDGLAPWHQTRSDCAGITVRSSDSTDLSIGRYGC